MPLPVCAFKQRRCCRYCRQVDTRLKYSYLVLSLENDAVIAEETLKYKCQTMNSTMHGDNGWATSKQSGRCSSCTNSKHGLSIGD